MSPICGAHQPRQFGSRLMGFLLPEILPRPNQSLATMPAMSMAAKWRQRNPYLFQRATPMASGRNPGTTS